MNEKNGGEERKKEKRIDKEEDPKMKISIFFAKGLFLIIMSQNMK